MAYLFDTDAISELFRRRPLPRYVEWLRTVPREDQFTSAVVLGELYEGAYRSGSTRHLEKIEAEVRPRVSVLPFDADVAPRFGRIAATLMDRGEPLPDADIQIAATTVHHGLILVTGNTRHFERVPDLEIEPVLAEARRGR